VLELQLKVESCSSGCRNTAILFSASSHTGPVNTGRGNLVGLCISIHASSILSSLLSIPLSVGIRYLSVKRYYRDYLPVQLSRGSRSS
jgi:hypothetical protein